MERCRSCLQLEMQHSYNSVNNNNDRNNNNNNNNSIICNYNSSDEIMTASKSIKSISVRQSYKMRQHQQQQQRQQNETQASYENSEALNMFAIRGIRDTAEFITSISTIPPATANNVYSTASTATITTNNIIAASFDTSKSTHRNIWPRYSASNRKRHFHRQTSNRYNSDSVDSRNDADEADYHADLEDDAPELQSENEHEQSLESPERTPVFAQSYHRQLRFAQNKPHSDSMLVTAALQRRLRLQHENSFDSVTTIDASSFSQRCQHFANHMGRDSCQSMSHSDSSRYSSVDSLLESRKPDPEAILINLGFGPVGSEDILSRIPKRFLKPSQVRGIDTEAFVKRLQLASHLADHSVLGYRGLTGNPDVPPSSIVAKIMERFEVNQRKKSMGGIE